MTNMEDGRPSTPPEQPDITSMSPEDYSELSIKDRVTRLWMSAKNDIATANRKGQLVIGGFVANIGYELFIGNEVTAPLLGGQTLDRASGVGAVAASALITSIPVYAQQRLGGVLSRRTAQQFPSVSEEAYKNLEDEDSEKYKSFRDLPAYKRVYYSFVLGSTFNVTREAAVSGDVSDDQLKPIEKASARTTAATVAVLAAGTNVANQALYENETAQLAIDYGIKNPLFWLALGGGLIVKDSYSAKKQRRLVNDSEPEAS